MREAWSHREETPPTPLGRRAVYTVRWGRHWKAIKNCLRMSHISLNPETWETLSIGSNHSSASVPWSQICWAQASDVGSYPHRPTRPRPPTFFTQHKTWHSLKDWYVLPVQTRVGPEPMAGGRRWKFPCLLFCCYSLLHIWELFFTGLNVTLKINSNDQNVSLNNP